MFDRKQFQHKVYSMVTKEVHDACTELLKGDRKTLRIEAIQIQRQVIYAMNWVTEQAVLKIGNGLLLDKVD